MLWARLKGCVSTAGYGITGKTDDFIHTQHPHLTTEEGGCCLLQALCSPEGMLSMEGLKALAQMQMSGSGCSAPSLSLEAPEFQNVPCCPSLVSTLLHPKSSSSWDEKRNWEFKPLQLSSPGGGWRRGGHGCRMQTRSSKTFFQDTVSSQSISPSYFPEIEPIITIKSWGWKRFWGHRVQLLLAVTSVACQNLHFDSYSSHRRCLCFEVFLRYSQQTQVVSLPVLKGLPVRGLKKQRLLILVFRWLFVSSGPFFPLTSG